MSDIFTRIDAKQSLLTEQPVFSEFQRLQYTCKKITTPKIMEKHIKVSTQGRVTIPKQIRDMLGIEDGQPLLIQTDSARKEITLIFQPTISDFR